MAGKSCALSGKRHQRFLHPVISYKVTITVFGFILCIDDILNYTKFNPIPSFSLFDYDIRREVIT